MLYVFARVFDLIVTPSTLLVLLCVSGLILALLHRPYWGKRLLIAGVAGLVLVSLFPIGTWLLRPLEDRFPPLRPLPVKVDGIISLGGAMDLNVTEARGRPALKDSAARMTDFVALARRYPTAKLVFAGGSGAIFAGRLTEADVARVFYAEMGLDPRRFMFENKSRNTRENALLAKKLVRPARGERWLLVTTAADLPRAVGAFRGVGWKVIAVPADYHTARDGGGWAPGLVNGLRDCDWAMHEWIGLAYYRMRGWTPTLVPGPE